jgi:hypothetical protein
MVLAVFVLAIFRAFTPPPPREEIQRLASALEADLLRELVPVLNRFQDFERRGLATAAERELKVLCAYLYAIEFFSRRDGRRVTFLPVECRRRYLLRNGSDFGTRAVS